MVNYNELFGVEDSYQVPEKLMKTLLNKKEREELFMKLLRANNMNVDFDWFFEYFQDEHADRRFKKQDFTPQCVANLLSKLEIKLNKKVEPEYSVNADIIGGLIVEIGDKTIDCSLKTKFDNMQKQLTKGNKYGND